MYSTATISPILGYLPFSDGLVIAYLIPDSSFRISGPARAGEDPTVPAATTAADAEATLEMKFLRSLVLMENAFTPTRQKRNDTIDVFDTIFVAKNTSLCFVYHQ